MQINTCSESKCSSAAPVHLRKCRMQQKEQTATHSISPLLCDGVTLCKRQQPAHLLRELQAGLCGCGILMCRVSTEIRNNLCPCNIRQVAMCKAHNLSILRNAYNHNLFLWKSLSFQPLFIYDTAPSRTGNVWCLWVINKTRTVCTLLVDVTSAAENLLCWSMPVRGWVSSYFVYSLSFSSCKSPAALQLRLGSELLKYGY